MNPSICQAELEPVTLGLAGARPPDLDHDRFIAVIGGAFTGVRHPHRILLPRLTNAVYGKIPDDQSLPEAAVAMHGEVVCGTRDEIISFQERSTKEALEAFCTRTDLWEANVRFQEDLKRKGVNSFILGFDARVAVDETSDDIVNRPNRKQHKGVLTAADVEFIRKVFSAAFPGKQFSPVEMAEALLAYQDSQYRTTFRTHDDG